MDCKFPAQTVILRDAPLRPLQYVILCDLVPQSDHLRVAPNSFGGGCPLNHLESTFEDAAVTDPLQAKSFANAAKPKPAFTFVSMADSLLRHSSLKQRIKHAMPMVLANCDNWACLFLRVPVFGASPKKHQNLKIGGGLQYSETNPIMNLRASKRLRNCISASSMGWAFQ